MTTKVLDLFDGTAGTNLNAHTPDTDVVGGGWTDNSGNVKLDGSGGLYITAANSGAIIDAGTTDQWITANWNSGGADNRYSIMARNNNVLANASETNYNFNHRVGDPSIYIDRIVNNSWTTLASDVVTSWNTSATYTHEISVNGSSIEWKINGTSYLTATDSGITTGTRAGFHHNLHANNNGRFYDFQVDDAASGGGVLQVSGSESCASSGSGSSILGLPVSGSESCTSAGSAVNAIKLASVSGSESSTSSAAVSSAIKIASVSGAESSTSSSGVASALKTCKVTGLESCISSGDATYTGATIFNVSGGDSCTTSAGIAAGTKVCRVGGAESCATSGVSSGKTVVPVSGAESGTSSSSSAVVSLIARINGGDSGTSSATTATVLKTLLVTAGIASSSSAVALIPVATSSIKRTSVFIAAIPVTTVQVSGVRSTTVSVSGLNNTSVTVPGKKITTTRV